MIIWRKGKGILRIMKSVYYVTITSSFGDTVVVWTQKGDTQAVMRILLPVESDVMDEMVRQSFPDAIKHSHGIIDRVCMSIQNAMTGQEVTFSEEVLDMSVCGEFQRKVLKHVIQIPRGRVSTYSKLAEEIGISKGARAVGNAVAQNPFPIVVPCHRVIKADGGLGGFGGGLTMKKTLLSREGVEFDVKEKVSPQCLY